VTIVISNRAFIRHVGKAQRAANNQPVFITFNGRPAYVLMSFEHYQRLTKQRRNIAEALAMPDATDIEFEANRAVIKARPADFS